MKEHMMKQLARVREGFQKMAAFLRSEKVWPVVSYGVWFFSLFVWMEVIFHVFYFHNLWIFRQILLCLPVAGLFSVVTHLFSRRINCAVGFLLTFATCFFFDAEIVYYTVFHTFMAPFSLISLAENAVQFKDVAISKALTQIPVLLVMNAPLVVFWILVWKKRWFLKRKRASRNKRALLVTLCLWVVSIGAVLTGGVGDYTPYDLYYRHFSVNDAVDSLGVVTSVRLDAQNTFWNATNVKEYNGIVEHVVDFLTAGKKDSLNINTKTYDPALYHVMDYDFAALEEEEQDADIDAIHEFISNQEPDRINTYTGMFQGYNLVWITAESLWKYAVREDTTPTLYKMMNEGFVVNHYYTPLWAGSTIGGEFADLTSLIPMESGPASFEVTGEQENDMRTTLSMKLSKLDYLIGGYHSYHYDFNTRDKSHPNMNMPWWGWGNGYEAERNPDGTYMWPQSDLKLAQDTVGFYMDSGRPFYAYYMSFSGHANWGLNGENAMSVRNWDAVKDLDYSEEARCYLAANMELDKMAEFLIQELQERNLLDRTLFVIVPDHIPYTDKKMCDDLAGHEMEEVVEWCENCAIIWSASMKEPVVVDKYCSSLDILPTVCNLMGVEYDSRLLMGRDMLGDSPQMVVFHDHSWISDRCIYYAATNKAVPFDKKDKIQERYIEDMNDLVKDKFKFSMDIVNDDYYAHLPAEAP